MLVIDMEIIIMSQFFHPIINKVPSRKNVFLLPTVKPKNINKVIHILLNNQAFYRNALKNTTGQTSFRYQTNNYAIDLILAQIKEIHKFDEIPFDIRFQVKFYMRAISESINDWFLAGDNKQFPIEKFTDLLVKAMPKELSPYLPLIRK